MNSAFPKKLFALTLSAAHECPQTGASCAPEPREALLRLGENYRLGVISNADGKIAEVLDRCEIADLFETITDSGIVGKEKPHPAIFEAAVNSLGVLPDESLYIGDLYSVDYLGATRFGIQSVLFDVAGTYKNHCCPVKLQGDGCK